MRILDIVQFYSPLSGGVKRYIHGKMRYLAGCGNVEHAIIVPSDGDRVRTQEKSRVYELRCPPLPGSSSYRMLISKRRIDRAVAAERPDIIEVDNPYRAAWIGADIGSARGIPVVAFYHSDYPRALGGTTSNGRPRGLRRAAALGIGVYLRRLYGRMAATLVAAPTMLSILRDLGIPRLELLALGTDTGVFRPRDSRTRIREALGMRDDGPLLLYAGRLAREKNVMRLIDMMDHLPSQTGCRLVMIGDGELRRWVLNQEKKRTDLRWLPYMDSANDLADHYCAADLVVHPGQRETFCLVSAEAQACGTRVIAVRDGGVDHTVEGETPAVLSRSAEGRDLADAVLTALALGETAAARRARSRRAAAQFDCGNTYRRLVDLYDGILARGGGAGKQKDAA